MHPKLRWALACFAALSLIACPVPALADEKPEADAYAATWESLSDLIRRREYGNAATLLDSLADDPKLRGHEPMIEADKAVIQGLLALEQTVRQQAAKLSEGSRIDIQGIGYSVIEYEKNAAGDELVLRSLASGKEARKPVASLPSATWMQLAESKLDAVSHPELVLGVFAGFDRSPDAKAARKLFNAAAGKGANVSRWLARLEEAVNSKNLAADDTKDNDEGEPIVGRWRVAVGKDKWVINLEVRADGTSVATAPIETLIEMRKRKMPPPPQNPVRGKWIKNEDGTYQITLTGGATAQFVLMNNRLVGKSARGDTIVALRQATR